MLRWKRLTALLLAMLLCVSLAGCAKDGEGVALSVCAGPAVETLDPIYAENTADQTILVHLYENLMRVAADASGGAAVVPGMAKSVDREENHDGTVTFTFRLRAAKWSDGEPVKAGDFVYAWRRLADPASYSPYAELLSVVSGYAEARSSGDMEQLQVSAKNDDTLVVVLNGNYDWFLTEVCTSPATMPLRQDVVQRLKTAAQEAKQSGAEAGAWWEDPTALVTNGAYQATAYEEGSSLTAASNERYHGDSNGPREIVFRFADTAEEAAALYDSKAVDAVWTMTEEQLAALSAEEEWTALPELGVYTVVFNCAQEPFSDAMIRQAMSLAVDRNALAQAAGITTQAAEGLVPPGVPENEEGDFRTVGGALLDNDPETYQLRCDQAKALLEEAGYGSGADLGELEYLYVDEGTNGLVAQTLCQQWRDTLGTRVTPVGVTLRELWKALRTGAYTLAGVDLDAAGNDAECFLMDWTSGSQDNVAAYANTAYDTLMAIIASAADGTARMGCLHDAEELLLMDYALCPLYTRGTAWELRDTLTGACRDPRGWFSFAGVMTRAT